MLAHNCVLVHSSRDTRDKSPKETWHFSFLMLVSNMYLLQSCLSAEHYPDFRANILFIFFFFCYLASGLSDRN